MDHAFIHYDSKLLVLRLINVIPVILNYQWEVLDLSFERVSLLLSDCCWLVAVENKTTNYCSTFLMAFGRNNLSITMTVEIHLDSCLSDKIRVEKVDNVRWRGSRYMIYHQIIPLNGAWGVRVRDSALYVKGTYS